MLRPGGCRATSRPQKFNTIRSCCKTAYSGDRSELLAQQDRDCQRTVQIRFKRRGWTGKRPLALYRRAFVGRVRACGVS